MPTWFDSIARQEGGGGAPLLDCSLWSSVQKRSYFSLSDRRSFSCSFLRSWYLMQFILTLLISVKGKKTHERWGSGNMSPFAGKAGWCVCARTKSLDAADSSSAELFGGFSRTRHAKMFKLMGKKKWRRENGGNTTREGCNAETLPLLSTQSYCSSSVGWWSWPTWVINNTVYTRV